MSGVVGTRYQTATGSGTDIAGVCLCEHHPFLGQTFHIGSFVGFIIMCFCVQKGKDVSCQPMSSTINKMILGRCWVVSEDIFSFACVEIPVKEARAKDTSSFYSYRLVL